MDKPLDKGVFAIIYLHRQTSEIGSYEQWRTNCS